MSIKMINFLDPVSLQFTTQVPLCRSIHRLNLSLRLQNEKLGNGLIRTLIREDSK